MEKRLFENYDTKFKYDRKKTFNETFITINMYFRSTCYFNHQLLNGNPQLSKFKQKIK